MRDDIYGDGGPARYRLVDKLFCCAPCRDQQVGTSRPDRRGGVREHLRKYLGNMICGNAALLYESPDEANGRKFKFSRCVYQEMTPTTDVAELVYFVLCTHLFSLHQQYGFMHRLNMIHTT